MDKQQIEEVRAVGLKLIGVGLCSLAVVGAAFVVTKSRNDGSIAADTKRIAVAAEKEQQYQAELHCYIERRRGIVIGASEKDRERLVVTLNCSEKM